MWPVTALMRWSLTWNSLLPSHSSSSLGCFGSSGGALSFERHVMPEYLGMYYNLPLASKVSGPIITPVCAL